MYRILIFFLVIALISSCTAPLFITKKNIDLYAIKKGGKIGYIDQKGKIRIPPVYDDGCIEFNDGNCTTDNFAGDEYAVIKTDGRLGAIDYKGNVIIPPQYDFLEQNGKKTFLAKLHNKYGILDINSDTILPFIFDSEYFLSSHDIAIGRIDSSCFLIYNGYKRIVKTPFQDISPFFSNLAEIEVNNKHGFIDTSGKIVIEPIYEDAWGFENGLAAVLVNGKWGFIDSTGKMIISPQLDYTFGFDFNKDAAIVQMDREKYGIMDRKYGLIDRKGSFLIPPIYEKLNFSTKDILEASLYDSNYNRTCGILNLKNEWIFKSQEYEILDYYEGYITIRKETGEGVIKLNSGKIILPSIFSSIDYYTDGLSTVRYFDLEKRKYLTGYVNRKGKAVWAEEGFDLKKLLKRKNKSLPG